MTYVLNKYAPVSNHWCYHKWRIAKMIEDIFTKIFGFVLAGGPSAIISILIAIIIAMGYIMYNLIGSATEREKRIDVIIDNYYKGNMDLTTAFNELKQVLYQIKDRVSR